MSRRQLTHKKLEHDSDNESQTQNDDDGGEDEAQDGESGAGMMFHREPHSETAIVNRRALAPI